MIQEDERWIARGVCYSQVTCFCDEFTAVAALRRCSRALSCGAASNSAGGHALEWKETA